MYLNAIQGLIGLGDLFPSQVVPLLCHQYVAIDDSLKRRFRHPDRWIEMRLKLGEALVIVAQRLGPLLPLFGLSFLLLLISDSRGRSAN